MLKLLHELTLDELAQEARKLAKSVVILDRKSVRVMKRDNSTVVFDRKGLESFVSRQRIAQALWPAP